jgi:hypothetical protein
MNDEPQILLEEISPHGTVMAVVETQRGVVFLYLTGQEDSGFRPRACWVRNLAPAPSEFEEDVVKSGRPPLLPKAACAHPQGSVPLDAERLRIVWFEEGDGAALYEGDELLAVIPPWSGEGGCNGYARDCVAQSPVCWPLNGADAIPPRLARAREFWNSWEKGKAHWPQVQDSFFAAYQPVLGKHTRYFSIDGGHWPPKAIAVFRTEPAVILLTLGVSILPQPTVEMYVEDPAPLRRIEFGMALPLDASDETIARACAYISGQAELPWKRFTWLGKGHTIQCEPNPAGRAFSAVVLTDGLPGGPTITMPWYRGDPINLLWMVPITGGEQMLAEQETSAALLERLKAKGSLCPRAFSSSVSG